MKKIATGLAAAALAISLTACGDGDATEDTKYEGQDTHDALVAAVEDGTAAGPLEKIDLPDTECVVSAIEDRDLSDEQIRVLLTGGDPDPYEDDAWAEVRDAIGECYADAAE